MRQQPSGRRPRGRSNRKQYVPHRSQNYDSHGPEVRVRGNALQVYEKYVNLARDATSTGDRIAAESYQQYAEHYYRIINDTTDPQRPAPQTASSTVSADAVGSEPAGSEPAEAEQATPERGGPERQRGGRQPYPPDAEQPFVEDSAKAEESAAASTTTSTGASSGASAGASAGNSEGNGQAPEAKPETEEDGELPVDEVEAKAAPAAEAKAKPRGRGRPRTRAKAGNGAAAEGDAEGAATPAKSQPCKAGEPTS